MEELSFEEFDEYLLKNQNKIIHQIWFGTIPNKREARKTFETLRNYHESWKIKNPNWVHVLWNLKRCNNLVSTYYKEHLEMYNKYPYTIQKCDAVRYFILHRYGGIYADMDYYCNKSFDEAFSIYTKDFYLVETPNKVGYESQVSNSLMYSKANHVFWRKFFIELEMYKTVPYYYGRHLTIMFTTGPGILNRIFHQYKYKYKLGYLPFKLFHPFGLNTEKIQSRESVYAMHIGKGTWENNDSKILIFLYTEYKLLMFIILILFVPYLFVV